MKTKIKSTQYRQGDVLIERIAKLPGSLNMAKPEHGRVILAHGEKTGHAHAFTADEATKFTGAEDAEFFDVKGRGIAGNFPVVRILKSQVMVKHPEHGLIEFHLVDVKIKGDRATVTGDFGLLRHDEHSTQAIPAGLYKGAGAQKTVHQREYSPEEIRRVAD